MPRNVTRLMRAATAMKFAATTTPMRRSKTPVIEAFRQGFAQRERGELGVLALGVEQRLAVLAQQYLLDFAEEDGMRAVGKAFHHAAIEAHQGIDQHGRAGGQARPVARLEARLAALRAAEGSG